MKGLKLNELFYRQIVAGILKSNFPNLRYSSALIGWGSEVLGYDDDLSTDHNWGLRFQIFLSEEDAERYSDYVNQALDRYLPAEFNDFPTSFEIRVNRDQRGVKENIKHNIDIETIGKFFDRYLGCNPYQEIEAPDWLTFPEHKLLAVTSGKVFYDGLDELETIRQKFDYYPNDIWLYLLAAQWSKIFEEQTFVGRCGQSADEVGSVSIAARQVKNLMRLCFLIERKYAPYGKWFGKAFSQLDCAGELLPVFEKTLRAGNWRKRQELLAQGYRAVIVLFNNLKIIEPMSDEISNQGSRPFLIIKDESVVEKLRKIILSENVRKIPHLLGSVNQFVDSGSKLNDVNLTRSLKNLYQ